MRQPIPVSGGERVDVTNFKHSYFYSVFWPRLKNNPLAICGGIVVLTLFAISISAPYLSPYDPGTINAWKVLSPPSWQHWFGTDELGRDVFSRVLYGSQVSLKVGFVSVGIAVVIGTVVGLASGYYSGLVDTTLMRFVDIMLCFPAFFLILAIITFLEPSIWYIMMVIGLTGWMGVARLVRAETLSIREMDYILAARCIGCSNLRIIFRHVLPNAVSPVLVSATLGVAGAILTESALSFLGIGVQPPTPSWGNILTSGKDYIEFAWWLSLFPGLAILVTVLAYNLMGEGIRDALDPRVKR